MKIVVASVLKLWHTEGILGNMLTSLAIFFGSIAFTFFGLNKLTTGKLIA